MIEIYKIKIDDTISDNEISSLLQLIPGKRNAYLKKFVGKKDLLRGLYSSLLIRSVISQKLNLTLSEIEFHTNENQKPFLKNHPNFHFNISHSGDYVICGVSNSTIGVDIELMKIKNLEIAESVFAEQELQVFKNLPENEKQIFFFSLWTLKESYIKATGKGLSLDLKSFYFKINNEGFISLFSPYQYKCINFKIYDIDQNYTCAVCAEDIYFPDTVISHNLNFVNCHF